MSVAATQLDGQNYAFVLNGVSSVDLFTLNGVTGAVSSLYFEDGACRSLEVNALNLFRVLTTLPQRQSVHCLKRLLGVGTLDGATISVSSVTSGSSATFRVSAVPGTVVISTLPHSVGGGFAGAQSVEVSASGSPPPDFSDLGSQVWDGTVGAGVVPGKLVAVQHGTTNLVIADNRDTNKVPTIGMYRLNSLGQHAIQGFGPVSVSGTYAAGAEIYLGIDGNATDVPPGTSGTFMQFIGISYSTTKVSLTLGEVVEL